MRLLLVAMVALLAAAGPLAAAPPDACPKAAALRRLLRVPAKGWQARCRAEPSGRILAAALAPPDRPGALPRIVVAVKDGTNPARRAEATIAGPEEAAIRALRPDEWSVGVATERIGDQELVRVGLLATSGKHLADTQEIVVFFRVGDQAPLLLWAGRGDSASLRMDVCFLESSATFRLGGPGLLERTIVSRRLVRGEGRRDPEGQRLAAECTPPPREHDVFPLP